MLPQAGHGVSGVGSLSSLPHGFRGLFVAGGIGVTPLFAMVAGLLGRSVLKSSSTAMHLPCVRRVLDVLVCEMCGDVCMCRV